MPRRLVGALSLFVIVAAVFQSGFTGFFGGFTVGMATTVGIYEVILRRKLQPARNP
jgi:hypothetical protein